MHETIQTPLGTLPSACTGFVEKRDVQRATTCPCASSWPVDVLKLANLKARRERELQMGHFYDKVCSGTCQESQVVSNQIITQACVYMYI